MAPVETQTNLFPCFSDEEYARRYRAVRQAMEEQDVHAILIFGARGSSEVHYISNYLAQSPCWVLSPPLWRSDLFYSLLQSSAVC